jgi:hypothetical protein
MYEKGREKSQQTSFDTCLSNDVNTLNRKLPMMQDEATRLDKVSAGRGEVEYFLSLPSQSKADLHLPELEETLRKNITVGYKTNSQLEAYCEYNVLMKYEYRDMNGDFLFEIAVSPKDFH